MVYLFKYQRVILGGTKLHTLHKDIFVTWSINNKDEFYEYSGKLDKTLYNIKKQILDIKEPVQYVFIRITQVCRLLFYY